MVQASRKSELDRLIEEVEGLRVKLKVARDAHTRDGHNLERLGRSIALVEREIAETSTVIGAGPSARC
jgi:hypothetical protein